MLARYTGSQLPRRYKMKCICLPSPSAPFTFQRTSFRLAIASHQSEKYQCTVSGPQSEVPRDISGMLL
jgi:hypothetical protein